MKHTTKYDTATGNIESTETLKYGAPKIGPINPWFTVDFIWNSLAEKKAVKNSLNFQYNDYHLGYKLEHDLSALKSASGVFALKNAKGDFFLKSDLLKKHVTLGCNHKHGSGAWHSIEATYDINQKV